jgi:anthraniloyl-CoA monooxygenase
MRVAIVGGGPGGLYAAILLRKLGRGHEVTVWERNAPDDTFGFGVVFSDETLAGFEAADAPTYADITSRFAHWEDIDIEYRGRTYTSGGHGFAALERKALLQLLQRRATDLGAVVHFRSEAPDTELLAREYDLVIGADGRNSPTRTARADDFRVSVDRRLCKYMWLGTDLVFDAFKFIIKETEHGVFQVHAYPYSPYASTFIVEAREETWRSAGLDVNEDRPMAPGDNDEEGIAFVRELFSDTLAGHSLVGNNSQWLSFETIRTESWRSGNVVLLGDAAHTAHFSIGSGTKLAMEDSVALAWALREHPEDVDTALIEYEGERRPVVESTQRAAQASLEWFEGLPRYLGQRGPQFSFNLLVRSRRITYDNLRLRDPRFVGEIEADADRPEKSELPPMFWPLRLRELELANRVVVSPMDMYSADDGLVGDFHLVHLGSRAVGGAGLVMTEMICVSREGRITHGCGGLYLDEHTGAWRRIVDFVHEHSYAKIGAQLGHSGRKGATKLMWEGVDQPLESGAWPVMAPSPIPYFPHSQVPREMTRADMNAVRRQFVEATRRAREAGFDLLELHMAHGYLLSSFISPVTNRRNDRYGGDLDARVRFPLEVLAACREEWPAESPLSVRISAVDWVEGGQEGDDAVELARTLHAHGCDIVDVSSGQVSPDEKPALGRSFQTPFADRIRNEAGVPTIAVGAISSAEDVNTIILAGWADLCALGRPHLYDPHWTLHAAADSDVEVPWIVQYRAGNRRPPSAKDRPEPLARRFFDQPAPVSDGRSRYRPGAPAAREATALKG